MHADTQLRRPYAFPIQEPFHGAGNVQMTNVSDRHDCDLHNAGCSSTYAWNCRRSRFDHLRLVMDVSGLSQIIDSVTKKLQRCQHADVYRPRHSQPREYIGTAEPAHYQRQSSPVFSERRRSGLEVSSTTSLRTRAISQSSNCSAPMHRNTDMMTIWSSITELSLAQIWNPNGEQL